MEAGLSQRSLDIIPVAVGVGMGVPENTRRLLWERYVEGYWGDLLGGRLGAPSSELGPREQIEGEIQAPPQSFAGSHSVGMVGCGAQEGWGWFPHWTSPTLPVLKLGAGWA